MCVAWMASYYTVVMAVLENIHAFVFSWLEGLGP